jgi:hypothetical protein
MNDEVSKTLKHHGVHLITTYNRFRDMTEQATTKETLLRYYYYYYY